MQDKQILKKVEASRDAVFTSIIFTQDQNHSESLLLDILEHGDHLNEFCLSAKACEGILRRAEKRGKKIPEILEQALKAQAHSKPNQEHA